MTAAGAAQDPVMVGPYRVIQRLGEGGMGVVHLAIDPRGRAVALKVLRPQIAADPEARLRLAREVVTLRRVSHPRVAGVIDANLGADLPYMVTGFVPGRPLHDVIREGGPLPPLGVARLGRALAEALQAIHAAGVIHRDVKPANVMLVDGEPVLIDFGIAHVADESRITSTGLVIGTPGYLPPEVAAGAAITPATDWWGWGATLAYSATGRPPFGSGPAEAVLDRVRRGQVDLDGVPQPMQVALRAALAVDPSQRPREDLLVGWLTGVVTPAGGLPQARTAPEAATISHPASAPAGLAAVGSAPPSIGAGMPPTVPHQPVPPTVASPGSPPPAGPAEPELGSAAGAPSSDRPANSGPAPRTGVLLAVLAALSATAAVIPVAALLIAALLLILARTADRSRQALLRRRDSAGARPSDTWWLVMALPWRLAGAALVTLPAMVLPLAVGLSAAFLTGGLPLVPGAMSDSPGDPIPLAVAMLSGLLTAWWGPGGGSVRRGSRALARRVAPGEIGPAVAVGVLTLVLAADVLVARQGVQDWAPLPDEPSMLVSGSPLGDRPSLIDSLLNGVPGASRFLDL